MEQMQSIGGQDLVRNGKRPERDMQETWKRLFQEINLFQKAQDIKTSKELYFLFCYKTKTTREMKTTFGTHDQTSYMLNRGERTEQWIGPF